MNAHRPSYFWPGVLARIAVVPFLLQWFHPDERQMLEFAHFHAHHRLQPFMESELHLRNQTLPWMFGQLFKLLDAIHLTGPWPELILIQSTIAIASWLALDALARSCKRPEWAGWFFAVFWAFPFLYSRGLLEAASLPPTVFLYLAVCNRRYLKAGLWGGVVAILRYPSALWMIGGAILAYWVETETGNGPESRRRWFRGVAWATFGFAIAVLLGGIADLATYGKFLGSAPAYWNFNRPHGPVEHVFGNDSLFVYWRWFEYIFTPWLAPLMICGAIYSLGFSRGILVFALPYVIGHFWSPHREPRFMLPLTPFLIVALTDAWAKGRFDFLKRTWGRLPRMSQNFLGAVGIMHVAVNFIWYPLNLWAQWSSGQAQVIREYEKEPESPVTLLNLADPWIDAFVPPAQTWADSQCRLHRPLSPSFNLNTSTVKVLAADLNERCVASEPSSVPAIPRSCSATLE